MSKSLLARHLRSYGYRYRQDNSGFIPRKPRRLSVLQGVMSQVSVLPCGSKQTLLPLALGKPVTGLEALQSLARPVLRCVLRQ